MTLSIKNRDLVVPGDLLAKGDYLLGGGTYRDGDNVYASILGLVDIKETFIKVIPLSGKYVPRQDDLVIGTVTDITFSSWYIDMNSPYQGMLTVANATERFIESSEDLSKIYNIADVVLAKVSNVSQSMIVGLTMKDRGLYKLNEGRLISISPTKVPRVIGKKGTMVNMLKELTGCKIIVGQNGRVWISGGNENQAIEAIRYIEENAHTPGLTDKIKEFLGKGAKESKAEVKVEATPPPTPSRNESPDIKSSTISGDSSRQPPAPEKTPVEEPREESKIKKEGVEK